MTQARRYENPCGIARALDAIGDRWALLVVRELILGPKRFYQLRTGLRTVSPNVLSQRLRDLEVTGVVRRDVLPPPASVAVYELTARGRALEPVLLALGRWGSREPITTARELTTDAFLVALKAAFDPVAARAWSAEQAKDPRRPAAATYALDIGGDTAALTVGDGVLDITLGRPEHQDAGLAGDMTTMRAVAFGREPIADAEQDGRLTVSGDRALTARFASFFPVPGPSPAD